MKKSGILNSSEIYGINNSKENRLFIAFDSYINLTDTYQFCTYEEAIQFLDPQTAKALMQLKIGETFSEKYYIVTRVQ